MITTGEILYYPIFPNPSEPGADRSNHIRQWVGNQMLRATLKENKTNVYLVATGDGGFMRAARFKHGKGKVFFGVNCGTKGFLLNEINEIEEIPTNFNQLELITVNLIQATFYPKEDDNPVAFLAFNDIFCGATIADYITFNISGELTDFPTRTVIGSGVLVSTPQGSTSYALKALGSSAMLPIDTKTWIIGGIATGPYPNDQVTPQKIVITVSSRSDVNGYADGKAQMMNNIKKIIIEPTDHHVTIGFLKGRDFRARRRRLAQEVEQGK